MEYSEIAEIIKEAKPHLKDSSIKQYISSLKNLNKKATGSDILVNFEFVNNPPYILDIIKDLHITSQRNTLTAIITILDDKQKELKDIYGKKVQELNKQQTENYSKNVVSEKTDFKLKNWTTKDIENNILQLKIKQQYDTALLLSLIYHYLFRNEVATLKLIKKSQYEKLTQEDKLKENYIVKHYSNMFISRGVYKTSGKHGLILTKVDDKILKSDLLSYIKTMKTNEFFPGMTNELVSKRISRATSEFKDPVNKDSSFGLGTSSINKIVIENLPGIEKLVQISKDRGTSISTLLQAYYNNY